MSETKVPCFADHFADDDQMMEITIARAVRGTHELEVRPLQRRVANLEGGIRYAINLIQAGLHSEAALELDRRISDPDFAIANATMTAPAQPASATGR